MPEGIRPDPVEMNQSMLKSYDIPGKHTILICPECGGPLWEIRRHNLISFQCHVGHTFSLESFLEDQAEEIELSLWKTLRTLKDRAEIFRQLAAERSRQDDLVAAHQLEMRAENALKRAELLRQALQIGELKPDPESLAPNQTSDVD
jgi:two-component system chemotaxis response regulator CheB